MKIRKREEKNGDQNLYMGNVEKNGLKKNKKKIKLEEMRKEEKERSKERNRGRRAPTQLPGTFCRLLRTAWIIRWDYSETPVSTGRIMLKNTINWS